MQNFLMLNLVVRRVTGRISKAKISLLIDCHWFHYHQSGRILRKSVIKFA